MNRRIAACRVVFVDDSGQQKEYVQHVVELIGQRVVRHYPLLAELPHTEWFRGTLLVTPDSICLLTTSADGTQHKQSL